MSCELLEENILGEIDAIVQNLRLPLAVAAVPAVQGTAAQDVMVEMPSGEWRHDVKLFLACIASTARLEWLFAEISAFCVVTQDIGLLINFILSCYIYAL